MIEIRKMKSSEIHRISEIDRKEHISQYYTFKDGVLKLNAADWQVEQWDFRRKIEEWAPIAEGFKNMWGAFHSDKLVGFAVYRANLTDQMAQFAILQVSQGYRKKGIGEKLSRLVFDKARADGKSKIYVTATPTKATVDFYMRLGFKLAEEINRELYDLEPDDIHLIRELKFFGDFRCNAECR